MGPRPARRSLGLGRSSQGSLDHELDLLGQVHWSELDLGVGGAPDAKDFVGESLAHLHDPSKIDDHFSKSVETARDAARFRTRYEAVASSKKLHDDACFRELEIGSVLVEDLSKRARRLQARLETNAGAASARSRPHGHVTYSIVHDPAQPTTVDLE